MMNEAKKILIEYRHIILLVLLAILAIQVYRGQLPYLSIDMSKNIALSTCLVIGIIYFLVHVQFQQPQSEEQTQKPARKRDIFDGFGNSKQ